MSASNFNVISNNIAFESKENDNLLLDSASVAETSASDSKSTNNRTSRRTSNASYVARESTVNEKKRDALYKDLEESKTKIWNLTKQEKTLREMFDEAKKVKEEKRLALDEVLKSKRGLNKSDDQMKLSELNDKKRAHIEKVTALRQSINDQKLNKEYKDLTAPEKDKKRAIQSQIKPQQDAISKVDEDMEKLKEKINQQKNSRESKGLNIDETNAKSALKNASDLCDKAFKDLKTFSNGELKKLRDEREDKSEKLGDVKANIETEKMERWYGNDKTSNQKKEWTDEEWAQWQAGTWGNGRKNKQSEKKDDNKKKEEQKPKVKDDRRHLIGFGQSKFFNTK